MDPEDLGPTKTHIEEVLNVDDVNKIDKTRRTKRVSFEPEGAKNDVRETTITAEEMVIENTETPPVEQGALPTNEPKTEPARKKIQISSDREETCG